MNIRALGFGALAALLALFVGCTPLENAEATMKNAGDTLKIGCILPLSGEYENSGKGCNYAAQLAVDEINEAGGADGIMFELVTADDEGSSEGAAKAYNELYDKEINALVSSFVYDSAIISTEKSNTDGILNILPNGSINSCDDYENSSCINYTYGEKGKNMLDMMKNDGCEKVAVLYGESTQYQLIASAFQEASSEDCDVVFSQEIDMSNEGGSVRSQLKEIKREHIDGLFLPVDVKKAEEITNYMDRLDMDVKVYGIDSWIVEGKDANLPEGTKISVPFTAENESAFTEKYLEDNGSLPDFYAAEVYDSIYAMKQAVEIANGDISNETLVSSVKNVEIDGLTGSVKFKSDGNPVRENLVAIFQDGKFKIR
jgi:branched-chain amino acid transport system substrate-binding protein